MLYLVLAWAWTTSPSRGRALFFWSCVQFGAPWPHRTASGGFPNSDRGRHAHARGKTQKKHKRPNNNKETERLVPVIITIIIIMIILTLMIIIIIMIIVIIILIILVPGHPLRAVRQVQHPAGGDAQGHYIIIFYTHIGMCIKKRIYIYIYI